MRKSWLALIIFFAIAGIVVAGYSLNLFYQIQSIGFDKPSFCNLSPTLNCDIVQASSYAAIGGVPVSGFGICFYIFTVLLALTVWFVPSIAHQAASFGWIAGLCTFIYSAFLAYISANVLRVWCPTCIIMYGINFVLWMGWWVAGRIHPVRVFKNIVPLFKYAAAFAVIAGLGAIFMLSKVQASQHATPEQIKDALYAFEKGSAYTLPTDWTDHPIWGNPNAKVTVVEFSDFECPFCRLAALNFIPTLIDFRNDVKLYFVNYPLDQSCNKTLQFKMHEHSCMAAVGAMCAYTQGNFWEFGEDVFRDQRRISHDMLVKLAEKHKLDVPKFTQCLDTQESMPLIQRDIDIGQTAQIHGTPSIFINGRQVQNWRAPEVVRAILKQELGR